MASSRLLSMEFPTRWRERARKGRGAEGERGNIFVSSGFFRFPTYNKCLFSGKKIQTRGQNMHSKGQKGRFGFNKENDLPSFSPKLNDVRLFKKTSRFACYSILDDVPHLSNWCPNLPSYRNPLQDNPAYQCVEQYFVAEDDVVIKNVVVKEGYDPSSAIHFRRAGPRDEIVFKPDEVRACIVTCGGLCPGLNTVIREVVCSLWLQYGVREIYGIDGGYRGFYARNVVTLDPKVVNDIHKRGGTILHTSRGGHETSKIVNAIEDRGINQVYIIGGDGTQRGADLVYKEVKRRGLKVAVAGIPKTIDNDIAVIDRSFGFDTAVEEAQRAINAAHVEAESVENGFGLVKLMGRYSGYIAMHATLASRDVDCCLIPEVPFYLEGPGGLYEYIRKRLRENGHMVLVVAEGAGQDFIAKTMGETSGRDKSGNRLLQDVGLWLSHNIKDYCQKAHIEVNLKYIDPTYMIRAIPSNASDNVYCTLLAHSAIHGAMAGYSGFIVGPVNGRHAYIPIDRVTETTNKVNVTDRMWARLLSSTQQPSFEHRTVFSEPKEKLPDVSATKLPVGVASGIVEDGREAPTKTQGGKVGFPKSESGGKGNDSAKGEDGKAGFTKSEDGGKDFAKLQDGKVVSTKSQDGGVASHIN